MNGVHFKGILSTKCKCICKVMKLGSFTHTIKKLKGPQSIPQRLCSLCIVELQQRHSELVNDALTSNDMSYLTKHCHCHWMCFMSNKKQNHFTRISPALLCFPSKHLGKLQDSVAAFKEKYCLPSTGCQYYFFIPLHAQSILCQHVDVRMCFLKISTS